jgi:NitT/TauT family transport system substrate-binding protein
MLAIDESLGGDGIIARKDIRSIADLRGKSVACPERTMSQFYLNVLLKGAGLSEADIKPLGDGSGFSGAVPWRWSRWC